MSRGEKPLLEHSKSVLESSLADVDGGGVAYLEWGSLACSCTNRQFWSWVDWGERDVWVESCTKGFHYYYIIIINSDGDTRRTESRLKDRTPARSRAETLYFWPYPEKELWTNRYSAMKGMCEFRGGEGRDWMKAERKVHALTICFQLLSDTES